MIRVVFAWIFAAISLLVTQTEVSAAEREAAELLPASTLVYAEISHPDQLIDLLAEHPLRSRLEEIDGFKQAIRSPQYLQFQLGVVLVEAQLGQGWRPALKSATAGGAAVAFDPTTQGAVLLVRAGDAEVLGRYLQIFVDLARQDAKGKGKPDPIGEDVYREVKVYKAGKAAFAVWDGWLIIVNKGDLGKSIIDRLLDGGGETLAGSDRFREARGTVGDEATAWAYVDMEGVRATGAKGPLETGRTENPVAELLVGGLVDNLRNTPYVAASLTLAVDRASVTIDAPHDASWVSEGRSYFFGQEDTIGPTSIRVDETLLTLTIHRDISQMWLRAGDLFEQEMADKLAAADSNLSTLFGGRDFGEEVLGSIRPELQVVVTRQDFAEARPRPAVKLPAFALVGRLKDPETMKGELRRTFLSVIGFANIIGSMNGHPQLDFDLEKEGNDQTIVTRYLAEEGEADSTEARINFNFSPSLAFVGDRVVLSSTEGLAREIIAAVRGSELAAEESPPNSLIELDASVLQQTLADNREPLIAQNMLSEGRDRPEAEWAIDALIAIIGLFRNARLGIDAADGKISLDFEVLLKP